MRSGDATARSRHGRLSIDFKLLAVYGAIAAPSSRNVDSQELHRGCCAKATIWRFGRRSNALETLTRGIKLNQPRLKRLEPVLMFGDDLFRRPGDEVVIAKFRLDLGDFEPHLGDLPIEARLLG